MEYRCINGDCSRELDRMIEREEKVDIVVTDPPYVLDYHGGGKQSRAVQFDKLKRDLEFVTSGFNASLLEKFLHVCKIPHILMFCSNKQISGLMRFFEEKGLSTTLLVWKKTNACPLGKGKHISDLEFVIFVRGKGVHFNNEVSYLMKSKLKEFPSVNGKKRFHPTEKPLSLMKEYIELHTFPGDLVLDPFMGSGTTGVACAELGRSFIGIELLTDYYKIAKERICNARDN